MEEKEKTKEMTTEEIVARIVRALEKERKLTLTVEETAQKLGISVPLARRLTHRADFPCIRLGGRVLIDSNGVEEWVHTHFIGGTQIELCFIPLS